MFGYWMQIFLELMQSSSGECGSFTRECICCASKQKMIGGTQQFCKQMQMFCERTQMFFWENKCIARECKCFESQRKVSLGNAIVLWANTKV